MGAVAFSVGEYDASQSCSVHTSGNARALAPRFVPACSLTIRGSAVGNYETARIMLNAYIYSLEPDRFPLPGSADYEKGGMLYEEVDVNYQIDHLKQLT